MPHQSEAGELWHRGRRIDAAFYGATLAKAAGIDLVHVPYGGAGGIQDLIGDRIAATVYPIGTALPQVQSGTIRALATTGAARSPLLPDVPTVREASFPTLEAEEWFGVLLPAQTPAAGVDRLNRAVRAITTSDGYKASLAKLSIKPADETPSEFFANHQIGIRPLGTDRAGVRLSSGRLAR